MAMSPPPSSAVIVLPGTSGTGGRVVRGPIELSRMPDFASSRASGPISGREAPATVQRSSG